MPTRTANLRAMSVDSRQGAKCVVDGPIGFRSGTDPEARHEVEFGVSVSHESRETVNQTKPMYLAPNQDTHNHKPNHCKQIKRNSFELAESHRLFTVENKEKAQKLLSQETEGMNKLSSIVSEREHINMNKVAVKMPSKAGRIPIKNNGTDVNGNDLEFKKRTFMPFSMEGDPILMEQTQIKLKSFKFTSNHAKPHKTTSNHIKPPKTL